MDRTISANFSGVEAGAKQIIDRARNLATELDKFHSDLQAFFDTQGGAAKESFTAYQATWNQHVAQLNTTLEGAGKLVDTGNSELQGTDVALANLF